MRDWRMLGGYCLKHEIFRVGFAIIVFGAGASHAREAPTRAPERLPLSRAEVKEYVEVEKLASVKLTEYQGVYRRAEGDLKNVIKQKASPEAVSAKEAALKRAALETELYLEVLNSWRQVIRNMDKPYKPLGVDWTNSMDVAIALPLPKDVAQRKTEFENRHAPAEVKKLADRFFNELNLDAKGEAPGAQKSVELYKAGHYEAAFDAFRDYFIDRLAHPEKYGLPTSVFILDDRPAVMTPQIRQSWVDDAMKGIASIPNKAKPGEVMKIKFSEPFQVSYAYLPFDNLKERLESRDKKVREEADMWWQMVQNWNLLEILGGSGDGLRNWLIDAYDATGDVRYLNTYAAYTDAWSMFMQRDVNGCPENLRYYHTLMPRILVQYLTRLRVMALAHPDMIKQYPSQTLARALMTGMDEYLSPHILHARWSRFNWNIMGMGFNMRASLLLSDFKAGQWVGRENARVIQNYMTFSLLPDGAYIEYSDEGHQGIWSQRISEVYDLARTTRPEWFDASFEAWMRESLTRDASFLVRHLKQDGFRHRDKVRSNKGSIVGKQMWSYGRQSLDLQVPWVTDSPGELNRMIETVYRNNDALLPRHTSDVLPYVGEFLFRGGWKKTDPFFYMHSGPVPNSNANEDINGFKLHNYGLQLVIGQPVYVDGRTQNGHYSCVDNPGGKTEFLVYSDGLPMKGRSHTSEHFDLGEGIYEGAYEERAGRLYWSVFQFNGFDMASRQKSIGKLAVLDVTHLRQVVYVRKLDAWVVIDRMKAKGQHAYEAPYEIFTPARKEELKELKDPGRIAIDPGQFTIRTRNINYPNTVIHQFSEASLNYSFDPSLKPLGNQKEAELAALDKAWGLNNEYTKGLLPFTRRVIASWEGEGDQVLISLLTTTQTNEASRVKIVERKGTSFVAQFGSHVWLKVVAGVKPFNWGPDKKIQVDTAVTVRSGTNEHSIILGPESSAEMSNLHVVRKIYAPILPVQFSAPADHFVEEMQVKLTCATPGTRILYTLDGKEPTLQSKEYGEPVTLKKSATLRALAVRDGATDNDDAYDPGYRTLPVRATFRKQALQAAISKPVTTGYAWRYAEGQPFALLAKSGFLAPQKQGKTEKLLDVSMHTPGKAFSVTYEGMFSASQDGVYTFHAPREFVYPDQDPGYDLRVFVDGQEWWPSYQRFNLGSWSTALAKGPHTLKVIFTDLRTIPYKHETWRNFPNPALLWKGTTPVLELTQPDGKRVTL